MLVELQGEVASCRGWSRRGKDCAQLLPSGHAWRGCLSCHGAGWIEAEAPGQPGTAGSILELLQRDEQHVVTPFPCLQGQFGDQPADVLRGAADEVLAALKNDRLTVGGPAAACWSRGALSGGRAVRWLDWAAGRARLIETLSVACQHTPHSFLPACLHHRPPCLPQGR